MSIKRVPTYSGLPCIHGHGTVRSVRFKVCVVCERIKKARGKKAFNAKRRRMVVQFFVVLLAITQEQNDVLNLIALQLRQRAVLKRWDRIWGEARVIINRRAAGKRKRERVKQDALRLQRLKDRLRLARKRNPNYRLREKANEHNRRALALKAGGRFTRRDLERLAKRQRGKCYWCSESYGPQPHADHVWPLAKGGSNGPENVVLACPTCNQTKHAKTPLEFAGRLL